MSTVVVVGCYGQHAHADVQMVYNIDRANSAFRSSGTCPHIHYCCKSYSSQSVGLARDVVITPYRCILRGTVRLVLLQCQDIQSAKRHHSYSSE